MGIFLLGAAIAGLALAVAVVAQRRFELANQSRQLTSLAEAKAVGSHAARLQYPHIDLSRCIGCDACVRACPEDGVLGLIHGQASVVYGARCVGHGRCATACPVGAISLTLANIEARRDLPALSEHFEVIGSPGFYLAGEVTGYALIRTAILHGTAIIDRIVERTSADRRALPSMPSDSADDLLDVVIIGAGPAGLAATLRAQQRGLRYRTLEQEQLGIRRQAGRAAGLLMTTLWGVKQTKIRLPFPYLLPVLTSRTYPPVLTRLFPYLFSPVLTRTYSPFPSN